MSGMINSSLTGSSTNLADTAGRSFGASFSGQSGNIHGMHNMHGSYNIPSMPGTLASRNSTMNNIAPGGVQQPNGNHSTGRFASNNLPIALSQLSHGSHGHTGIPSRGGINVIGNPGFSSSANGVGGSIPGILPSSAGINNRSSGAGLGVSPILGSAGSRMNNSMGSMVGAGNMGRNINSGGGLSVPGLSSRLNLGANNGSGNLGVQGQNRLMSGLLQQGSPQVISMLGNSYTAANVQAVNNISSIGMLNDVNPDGTPFNINLDFPQLTSLPSSAGPQGQIGSLRKQVPSIVQQNQEFSIQNEDFPALPGVRGNSTDYSMDLHQKDQVHDNTVSMMQQQHFSMGRSGGFNLIGNYTPHHPQQQQLHDSSSVGSNGVGFTSVYNEDLVRFHGSDSFPSSQSMYHSQNNGPAGLGVRPLSSPNTVSGIGSYEQLFQLYHRLQNHSQFHLQQMSAVNQPLGDPAIQASPPDSHHYDLLGLLDVIRTNDPDVASISLGIDLLTLGLNLNSSEDLHKTFSSPWSDKPAKGEPEFMVPQCYYAKQPPALHPAIFSKFATDTLFYIFYSMPRDEAQLYAANELYNREWFYHREHQIWLERVLHVDVLVKTNAYERGSYHWFDANSFEIKIKDNFVLQYEMVEKRPSLPQH